MRTFPVLIAYRAGFTDDASAKAGQTARRIRSSAIATNQVLGQSQKSVAKSISDSGRSMQTFGREMSLFVTLPVLGAAGASLKMASDFQTAMTQVRTLTEASGKQVDSWGTKILQIAPKLAQSPTALANSLYYVASAGIPASKALGIVEASAKAAAVGLGDQATVADAATSAINAYRASNLTGAQAVEAMAAAVKYGKLAPQDLATSLGRVIPVSSHLNVSFQQTVGLLAALSNTGLSASEATTALRQMFVEFLHPSHQAQEEATALGLSFTDLAKRLGEGPNGVMNVLARMQAAVGHNTSAWTRLFPNIRASTGVLNLAGGAMAHNRVVVDQVAMSTNVLNNAFAKVQKTTGFEFRKTLVLLQVDLVKLGNIMLPTFISGLHAVQGWLAEFSKLPEATKRTIIEFSLVAAAIGPAVFAIGTLLKSIESLSLIGAVFSPATLGTFALLAGAAYLVYKNWNSVGPTLRDWWPKIASGVESAYRQIKPIVQDISVVVKDLALAVSDFLAGRWDQLWSHAADAVVKFGATIKDVITNVVGNLIGFTIDQMTSSVQGFILGSVGLVVVASRFRALMMTIQGAVAAARGLAATEFFLGSAPAAGKAAGMGEQLALFGATGTKPGLIGNIRNQLAQRQAAIASQERLAVAASTAATAKTAAFDTTIKTGGLFPAASASDAAAAAAEATRATEALAVEQAGAMTVGSRFGAVMSGVAESLGTTGLAGVAVVAGLAIGAIAYHFLSGESAAQKFGDEMKALQAQLGQNRKLFTDLGNAQEGFRSAQLQVQGLQLQRRQEMGQLSGLKKGTLEYQMALVQLHQIELGINEAEKTMQAQRQKEVSTLNKLAKQPPNLPHLAAAQQLLSNVTAGVGLPNQTTPGSAILPDIMRLAAGTESYNKVLAKANDLGRLNGHISLAMADTWIPLAKNINQARTATMDFQRGYGHAAAEIISAEKNGLSPTNKTLQQIIGNETRWIGGFTRMGKAITSQLVPAAQSLGRLFTPAELSIIKTEGGINYHLRRIIDMLGRVPSVQAINFLARIDPKVRPAVQEFMKILHQVPSQPVVNLLVKHKAADLAIAAYVAVLHKMPKSHDLTLLVKHASAERLIAAYIQATHKMPTKHQLTVLSNIPQRAIPEIAHLIAHTKKIPSEARIKVIVAGVNAAEKLAHKAAQRVQGDWHTAELAIRKGAPNAQQIKAINAANTAATNLGKQKPTAKVSITFPSQASIKGQGVTIGQVTDQSIGSGIAKNQQLVTGAFNTVISTASSAAATTARSVAAPAGAAAIQGIDTGATTAAASGTLSTILANYVSRAVAAVTKKPLKSGSPSRWTAEVIGVPIMDGIIVGIKSRQKALTDALSSAVSNAVAATAKKHPLGAMGHIMSDVRHLDVTHVLRFFDPGGPAKLPTLTKSATPAEKAHYELMVHLAKIDAGLAKYWKDLKERFSKLTLAHQLHVQNVLEAMIRELKEGGITPTERHQIYNLHQILGRLGGIVLKKLQGINALQEHVLTMAQSGLQNLQLRQQLAGTDTSLAGAEAQAKFIQTKIEPVIREEIVNLQKQEREAVVRGNKLLARQIAEEIATKQNDLLQAQLDAQTAIKSATQQTAQNTQSLSTTGQLGFTFNDQFFRDLAGIGTGA